MTVLAPPSHIPARVEEITRGWLQLALAPVFPEAELTGVAIAKAHSGTTGRARLSLQWRDGSAGADLPQTLFAKFPPVDDDQKQLVTDWGMGAREARFYKFLAGEVPVPAPRVYYSDMSEDGQNYIMLMGDLRAVGARLTAVLRDSTEHVASELMQAFGRLHAAYWDTPRFASDLAWLEPYPLGRQPQTLALLQSAYDTFTGDMPPLFAETCRLVLERQHEVADVFESGTPTLVHGDSHIGNLFLDAGDHVGFFDWALCARMPGMWDVAYVLSNSFPTEFRRENERPMLERYRRALAEAGGPERSFDEVWEEYRLYVVYSWISTTITAGAGSRMQTIDIALRGARWTTQAMEDIGSLALLRARLG